MRRLMLSAVLFGLLMSTCHPQMLMSDDNVYFTGVSDLVVEISNGPSAGDTVTGPNSLAFTTSGTGTLVNLTIELSDDNSDWSNLATLSSSPWVYIWNSNSHFFTNSKKMINSNPTSENNSSKMVYIYFLQPNISNFQSNYFN